MHKVLLVDDDPTVNFLNRLIFADLDLAEEIITLTNGKDALEFIKEHCINVDHECPNLILVDLNMPIMDGKELLENLKKIDKTELINSKIAVLTSSDHPWDMAFLEKMGVLSTARKPLTEEKVMDLLDRLSKTEDSFKRDL